MTEDKYAGFLKNVTAESAAGQLLIVGFDGTRYTPAMGSGFKKLKPAGVILFARNIENGGQTKSLIADIKNLIEDITGLPPFVCVDQEGGRVSRLPKSYPAFPTAAKLGEDGSEELVEKTYGQIGAILSDLGFNVDFAPVLDLGTNTESPVIGDRAFSPDADKVARLGRAAIRGLRGAGILACGKHFPGHGDTSKDSHLDLPVDARPSGRLIEVEMNPFRMAVEERVEFMMTAHVIYPELDETYPATLSKKIITGILREQMGYEGVIVGDDLDMKAIAEHWPDEEGTRLSFLAGADMAMVCHETPRRQKVFDATRAMIGAGELDGDQTQARLARILKLKGRLA
ncbi:MAG: beta-N-acetylhexosaminidase [Nitrospinae bacterium]|nr:beta-N-acetylhexosaminidase [Nitrospinota bacterium]